MRGGEDVDGPEDVHIGIPMRIEHRDWNRNLSGEVINHVGVEMLGDADDGLLADVERVELHASTLTGSTEMVGVAAAQIIDDEYLPPFGDQQINEVRPDEPCPTRDERTGGWLDHRPTPQ
jgi:hypothetical protein